MITLACEGPDDEAVLRRLCIECHLEVGPVYPQGGKSRLDARLPAYNSAARTAPWLVLRNLDSDADCAAALCARLVPDPAPRMCFRVAVRAVEAWLMADRERFASFITVPMHHIPEYPETVPRPKQAVIALARLARSREVLADMLPPAGFSTGQGPGYSLRIRQFASASWRPAVAARRADSLARCLRALKGWRA